MYRLDHYTPLANCPSYRFRFGLACPIPIGVRIKISVSKLQRKPIFHLVINVDNCDLLKIKVDKSCPKVRTWSPPPPLALVTGVTQIQDSICCT